MWLPCGEPAEAGWYLASARNGSGRPWVAYLELVRVMTKREPVLNNYRFRIATMPNTIMVLNIRSFLFNINV